MSWRFSTKLELGARKSRLCRSSTLPTTVTGVRVWTGALVEDWTDAAGAGVGGGADCAYVPPDTVHSTPPVSANSVRVVCDSVFSAMLFFQECKRD